MRAHIMKKLTPSNQQVKKKSRCHPPQQQPIYAEWINTQRREEKETWDRDLSGRFHL